MDYQKTAREIYDGIGGKSNLVSAAHCATRLRLVIGDNDKCDKEKVEEIDGVQGVFFASGQMQIILGTGTVNKVYDEFIKIAGIEGSSKEEVKQAANAKQNVFKRAIKTLGDIFVPIIPAIVASGLLMGLLEGLCRVRNLCDHPSVQQRGVYIPADPDRHQRGEGIRRKPVPGSGHRYDYDSYRSSERLVGSRHERGGYPEGIRLVRTV